MSRNRTRGKEKNEICRTQKCNCRGSPILMGVCSTCGLPEELCICEEIAKEQQHIHIYSDTRRYGKVVTVVDGFESSGIDINELARTLKTKCASGGTVKDGKIELQGEHRRKVQETLKQMGYEIEM